MRGKIDLESWEISELTPWFEGGIYALETLELLGYKETEHKYGGWEQEAWLYYHHPSHKDLCFFYSGRYNTMSISLME